MNIEFSYLYRDGGNFKHFGSVIFSNDRNLDVESLRRSFSGALIDELFFEAASAALPPLFFAQFPFDPELDHQWHEFEGVEATVEPITDHDHRDIVDVLEQMQRGHRRTASDG